MRLKKLFLIIPTSLAMVLAAVALVIACMPSPQPPSCPQSIFLAKFAPAIVVIPPGGGPFPVNIGIVPFVTWDTVTPQCAQPVSATATFTLTCTPFFPPGPAFVVGPQTAGLANPVTPGAQPVPGGTVPVTMPAGTPPSVCLVMGTYDVTFGVGFGGGLLSGAGDTQVCLVEPSPADPSGDTPRLDLELLTPEAQEGPLTFHAGDQTYVYVKIANNDLERTAEFQITSDGRQTAGFATGFENDEDAYTAGIFRRANTDGDVFPAQFFDESGPLPFNRVPGDPLQPTDQQPILTEDFVLEPGEVEVFGIAINSFGACQDGSCNERNFSAVGAFTRPGAEPDPLRGCVSFTYLVDNALDPRYPGLTVEDELKVHPQVDAQWSTTLFKDLTGGDLDETHRTNLLPEQTVPELGVPNGIQTTGEQVRPPTGPAFPSTWFDQVTLPAPFDALTFNAIFFDQRDGFQAQLNRWSVEGLAGQLAPCPLPAISFQPGQPPPPGQLATELLIGLQSDGRCSNNSQVHIDFFDGFQQQEIFDGTLEQLRELAEQDPFFKLDFESCRTFRFPFGDLLEAPFLVSDPPFRALNIPPEEDQPFVERFLITDQFGNPVANFGAQIDGPPGASPVPMGNGILDVIIDPGVFTGPLDTREWLVQVIQAGFLNSPLLVPIVARRQFPPPPLLAVDFEFDSPPLAQVGQPYDAGIFIPPLDPEPVDPYFNMEFFIGIETNDPIEIMIPDPFLIIPIDPDTPADEADRLGGKFGEDPINRCTEGVWKCGKIEFGDGFTFETEIFVDGFESGDVSSWSTGAAADNSQRTTKQKPVGVLNEDKKLPVITEEELKKAIELFNDDVVFDEKTIGLVSERFGILEPLPPVRGTYFFDEFESFRKDGAQAPVTIDGSGCPAPCSGLVLQGGGGGVNGLRFEGFPDYGVVVESDGNRVTRSEFAGNGAGGLRVEGSGNVVGDALETANRFEDNSGAGVVVASGTGNSLLFNTFSGNAASGIDLGDDGVTDNDTGDGDTGANDLQNYPALTEALLGGSSTLSGTLNSAPEATFTVQFFASQSDACSTADNRQGEMLLGAADVTTDANGDAPFTLVVEGTVERFDFVTATATDAGGNTSELSACVQVVTGVAAEDEASLPTTFVLYQNYPNPFNPSTTIRYDVPQAGRVRLAVYDVLGRQVALLVDEAMGAGQHQAVFRAGDLPSGAYLYQLTGEGFTRTKKLVLLK